MTDNELAAIRARNAARTPGNWCVQGLPSELWRRICSESEYIDVSIYLPRIVHSQGNAEFIAGASVDIPALIAEVERLRAALAAQHKEIYAAWCVAGDALDLASVRYKNDIATCSPWVELREREASLRAAVAAYQTEQAKAKGGTA